MHDRDQEQNPTTTGHMPHYVSLSNSVKCEVCILSKIRVIGNRDLAWINLTGQIFLYISKKCIKLISNIFF